MDGFDEEVYYFYRVAAAYCIMFASGEGYDFFCIYDYGCLYYFSGYLGDVNYCRTVFYVIAIYYVGVGYSIVNRYIYAC